MKHLTIAAWLVSLCVTSALAKEPEVPLKRTGKWEINYAEGACHLAAAFGTQPDHVIARFTQVGPDQSLRLTLYGKPLGRSSDPFVRGQLTFLPAYTPSRITDVTRVSIKHPEGSIPAVMLGDVRFDNRTWEGSGVPDFPPITPAIEKSITTLNYVQRGVISVSLDLESMAAPMAAMRRCTADLVRSWGFDPAELATRQSRAEPSNKPTSWATTPDYPPYMLFRGASAYVTFRAAVDEGGAVTECFVLETTHPAEIGPHTCRLIKQRARFTPARDKDGRPVKDYYINRVFWKAVG